MTLHRFDVRDQTSSPLDYAKVQKPGRWRLIRQAVLWMVLAGLSVLAYRQGPNLLRKAAFLYYQRGCLRYTAAPDQVVFDSNPARVAALASDPNFAIVGGCAFRKPPEDWNAVRSSLAA